MASNWYISQPITEDINMVSSHCFRAPDALFIIISEMSADQHYSQWLSEASQLRSLRNKFKIFYSDINKTLQLIKQTAFKLLLSFIALKTSITEDSHRSHYTSVLPHNRKFLPFPTGLFGSMHWQGLHFSHIKLFSYGFLLNEESN